jgi:predicted alpha/beta hydrolase family esterase
MWRPLLLSLTVAALLGACVPRETIYHALGREAPRLRDFPADFTPPISAETGEKIGGFGGDGGGLSHTPIIFVHGNTVSANFWLPARRHFKDAGYSGDELWALSYGWASVRAFDSNDASVPTLDAFIREVRHTLEKRTGRAVPQVDIVAHSLGVTLVRQWMKQQNAWHRVRNFIAVCGANHGVWTARDDARGQNRTTAFELYPGSPWLAQLNRGGETPGATRTLALYDGSGHGDELFPKPYENSPALQGATNLPFDLAHGAYYDHLELPRQPATMDAMIEFIRQSHEPLPQAAPPQLRRDGERIAVDQPDALLRCAGNGDYPSAASPAHRQINLPENTLLTCYAQNPRSGLSSAMARYRRAGGSAPSQERSELLLTASLPAGVYEQPLSVALKASDPAAFIVYTTSGTLPESGSPLYQAPVYIAGAVTLSAIAIASDGRRSHPLQLRYEVSLDRVNANHDLQKQFEPAVK